MPTQQQLHEMFEYRDGALYWKVCLNNRVAVGSRAGTPHNVGYRSVRIGGKAYLEHRLIYLMLTGELPRTIDHINGIPDDNRIENLRSCTHSQNLYNARGWGMSGVKGVTWHKRAKRWQAQLVIDGKQRYLGSFTELEDAVAAVNVARTQHHGEFARP